MVLKKQGYRVMTATNGPEALRIADDLIPDLILLDIVLPGMDGFQVCQYIRRNSRTAKYPSSCSPASTVLPISAMPIMRAAMTT